MVDIHSATAEIRRGIQKKIEDRRRNHRTKILCPHLLCRADIKANEGRETKKGKRSPNQTIIIKEEPDEGKKSANQCSPPKLVQTKVNIFLKAVEDGQLSPHLAQYRLGRGLPSSHLDHLRYGSVLRDTERATNEWVGSFLTAHKHILGILVPYNGENVIKMWRYNQGYPATINMK